MAVVKMRAARAGGRRRFPKLMMAGVLLAVGCGNAPADARDRALDTGFRGVVLDAPLARPDFTLTDTEGRPYDFRGRTEGRLALLFFGYTNCPDICPVHMANLAAVLERFEHDLRARIALVFVTTDPDRDTPAVLRAWLDRFDPAFVGLTGTTAEIDRIQAALGITPAQRPADATGDYAVGHASQIVAFSPDGPAYVAYPAGVRQVDWAHDLPRLLEPRVWLEGDAP
jgi:protein SCO1